MADLIFSIPEELLERMEKYPEINWKKIAKNAVEKYLEKLELMDRLTSKSTVTIEDIEKWGDGIKQKMWERHKFYMNNLEE